MTATGEARCATPEVCLRQRRAWTPPLMFLIVEMPQQDLVDRVGITRQTVIALERGKYYPSLELAFLIAGAFGVALGDVFQHESPATSKNG